MKIKEVSADNLFSLDGFDISYENKGLILITGYDANTGSSNGAGKSSISTKLISWVLYGQTPGGIRGDDVINNNNTSGSTIGRVQFVGIGGEIFSVIRGRKPNFLKFIHSTKSSRPIDLTKKLTSDTQELINKELGMNFTKFINTTLFCQNSSFLSLSPSQQVLVLESILPVDTITQCVDYSKSWRDVYIENNKSLENQIHRLEGSLSALSGNAESLRTASVDFENERNIKIVKLESIINIATPVNIEETSTKLASLEAKLYSEPEIQLTISTKLNEINNISKDIASFNDRLIIHKADYMALSSQDSEIAEQCWTCGQSLSEEIKATLLARRDELRVKILTIGAEIDNLKYLKSIEESKLEKAKAVLTEKRSQLELNSTLNLEIQNLKNLLQYSLKITDLKKTLEEIKSEINPHEELKKNLEIQININSKGLDSSRKDLTVNRENLTDINFWIETFHKKFKAILFERACPFLTFRTQEHLKGLNNSHIKIEFSINKKLKTEEKLEFNIEVKTDSGTKGFDSLSGGEQQIASFAVGLALSDLANTQASGNNGILILDEPFVALDQVNCFNIVNYLNNELSSNRDTILLISNEEGIKSLIGNRIHVEKRDGITYVAG